MELTIFSRVFSYSAAFFLGSYLSTVQFNNFFYPFLFCHIFLALIYSGKKKLSSMKNIIITFVLVFPFSFWFATLDNSYFMIYFIIHWALGEILILKNENYSFSPMVNILKFVTFFFYLIVAVIHGKVILGKNLDLFLFFSFFLFLLIFLQFRERKKNPSFNKLLFFELSMIPVFYISFFYLKLTSMMIILQHIIFFFLASINKVGRKNIPIYLAQNIVFTVLFFVVGMKSSPLYIEILDIKKYYVLISTLHITFSLIFSPFTPTFLFNKIKGFNREKVISFSPS